MSNENHRVFMLCPTAEVAADVEACFKRVSAVLSAVNAFQSFMSDLPDDKEDAWAEMSAPGLERLTLTIFTLYPNGPAQFEADIKSIGDIRSRSLEDIKAKGLFG